MNELTIDGVNLSKYGAYMANPPEYVSAARDIEETVVKGRSGSILNDRGSYRNVKISYPIFIAKGFESVYHSLASFLGSREGYVKIETTWDPDAYRMGYLSSGVSLKPANKEGSGEFDLILSCKPCRYIKNTSAVSIEGTGAEEGTFTVLKASELNDQLISSLKQNGLYDPDEEYIKLSEVSDSTGNGLKDCRLELERFEWGKTPLFYILSGSEGKSDAVYTKNYNGGHRGERLVTSPVNYYFQRKAWQRADLIKFDSNNVGKVDKVLYKSALDGDGTNIQNSNYISAKPLIKIAFKLSLLSDSDAEGGPVLRIGEATITSLCHFNGYSKKYKKYTPATIYFDCETLDAYSKDETGIENQNSYITVKGTPSLSPGDNAVVASDLVDSVEIWPRWVTL